MGKYASKVIEQAKSWIGKKESNNTHREIIDVYNAHKPLPRGYAVKYTDAWCATFVSSVAIKLGYTDIIPKECSCQKQIDLFKKIGCWVENENRKPNVGDIIYYDWQDNGVGDNTGHSDHVGIVEKVSGDTLTIIEGNMNDAVGRRTLKVNGRYIRGYGVPKYDVETSVNTDTNTKTTYKVGDRVKVSSYYASSTDPVEKAIHKVAEGTITKVLTNGARNPYLLNNGAIGWCNDGDIREKLNTIEYYPRCGQGFVSIVSALKSIGVDSSYANRKKIAQKNYINDYTGKAYENNKLLEKLKIGRLRK